jgi:hypothetical protein
MLRFLCGISPGTVALMQYPEYIPFNVGGKILIMIHTDHFGGNPFWVTYYVTSFRK